MLRFTSLFLLLYSFSLPVLAADGHPYDSPNIFGQAIWIGEGDERFPALYAEAAMPEPKGVIIMLHAEGEHPQWPVVIQLLREQLTDHGWNTLALQLPIPLASARTLDGQAYVEMAGKKLQQAINHIMPKNPPAIVLLGHGLGANVVLKRATEHLDNNLLAVVGISINADAHQNAALKTLEQISQLTLPILDVYAERDRLEVRNSARQRKRAALKAGNKDYRQLKVPGADHHFNTQSALLGRRVKSWLDATYRKQLKVLKQTPEANKSQMVDLPEQGRDTQPAPMLPVEKAEPAIDKIENTMPAAEETAAPLPTNEMAPENSNPTGPEGLF